MELSLTDRLTRTEQPVRAERKKDGSTVAVASPKEQTRTDQVSLSKQAVEYLEEQRCLSMERFEQEATRKVREEAEERSGDETELDALSEALKTTMKCMEIARRIMRGDKVPPEDERYLMNNDPNGYKLALAMRTPKKHPKEWDSILEDAVKNSGSGDNGTEETVAAEETAASEGAPSGDGE